MAKARKTERIHPKQRYVAIQKRNSYGNDPYPPGEGLVAAGANRTLNQTHVRR